MMRMGLLAGYAIVYFASVVRGGEKQSQEVRGSKKRRKKILSKLLQCVSKCVYESHTCSV